MTGIALQTDVAALLASEQAVDSLTIVDGDANDGLEQNGRVIDRFEIAQNDSTDERRRGLSAGLFLGGKISLEVTQTLTLITNLQDSEDGVTFADFDQRASALLTTALPSLLLTGAVTDVYRLIKQQYDLTGARRYLRVQYTAMFSGGGAGNQIAVVGMLVFGGDQNNAFEPGLVGSFAVV
ncbi:MAG: hypothetical protein ACREIS_08235 [Nitrospiraceae bacterium]